MSVADIEFASRVAVQKLFCSVQNVTELITLVFSRNKLHAQISDGASRITDLEIPASACERYWARERTVMTVNFSTFYSLLQTGSPTDRIGFYVCPHPATGTELVIVMTNLKDTVVREYRMRPMNEEGQERNIPPVIYDVRVRVPAKELFETTGNLLGINTEGMRQQSAEDRMELVEKNKMQTYYSKQATLMLMVYQKKIVFRMMTDKQSNDITLNVTDSMEDVPHPNASDKPKMIEDINMFISPPENPENDEEVEDAHRNAVKAALPDDDTISIEWTEGKEPNDPKTLGVSLPVDLARLYSIARSSLFSTSVLLDIYPVFPIKVTYTDARGASVSHHLTPRLEEGTEAGKPPIHHERKRHSKRKHHETDPELDDDSAAKREPNTLAVSFKDTEWNAFFQQERQQTYYTHLVDFLGRERALGKAVFPPAHEIFTAYESCPLKRIKVVILGQDPYPTQGQGHGLCFSVKPSIEIPHSLDIIFNELAREAEQMRGKDVCEAWETLLSQWERPEDGYLMDWAKQGVFMLNSVLTVEEGRPNSHAKQGWKNFTKATLQCIDKHCPGTVFLLWGREAQTMAATAGITRARHHILHASHPAARGNDNDFVGSNHFALTNEYLVSKGRRPIDWSLKKK